MAKMTGGSRQGRRIDGKAQGTSTRFGHVDVLGIPVAPVTYERLNEYIAACIEHGRREAIYNVNVHALNLAVTDTEFRRILKEGPLVFADGAGVVLGARLLGRRLPGRITFVEWFPQLARIARGRGYSFFFLGGEAGVAETAAEALQEEVGDLDIRGFHHGYFQLEGRETARVRRQINRSGADILVAGLGMPRQEKWIHRNIQKMDIHVALPAGGFLDVLAGRQPRCPRWLGDLGLNWLFRLVHDPVRLWRRYLIGNPLFLYRILRSRFRDPGSFGNEIGT